MEGVRERKREGEREQEATPTLLIPSSVMKWHTSSAEAYDALILVIGSVWEARALKACACVRVCEEGE